LPHIVDEYDAFLIDLDGTVWVGRDPIPGAADAITALISAGKSLVFVTNDSRSTRAELAGRLREIGVEASDQQVLTAGAVTAQLAAAGRADGNSAFVIGAPALRDEVRGTGLELLESDEVAAGKTPHAVLVALHPDFSYAEMKAATLAIQRGAKLFATNREPGLPMPDGVWPGTGAILAGIEYATGATAEIGGKPERALFEMAIERLLGSRRVAMIGDSLVPDIGGAAAAGLATILVLTGNASAEAAERSEVRPDHIIESIAELARIGGP
jgi:glycerol-1-phosphatase